MSSRPVAPRTISAHRARAVAAETITIRRAYADDDHALLRLATLDSAGAPPPPPVLLAEVDGELRAALSMASGSVVADPFSPTLHLLDLLRTHATAIAPTATVSRRPRRMARLRLA
ncbi:MAG: hypothetical protein JOZ64_02935 [Solirubrobacterales bacterium]|nr:hypothetical protein [Solirubrobacterales bacterium]